jgi:hypothetical protein
MKKISFEVKFVPRLQAVKQILLFIATQKINKHTDQLISVNALGLAHKTIQFYAIKFVQKYYQP